MSLRLRLALVVVGLVAAGLLVTDVVTYTSLRSFLTVRLDQQLREAVGPVSFALERELVGAGYGEPPSAPPGGPVVMLPPGTYGELRAADGTVLARVQFEYTDVSVAVPDLPAELPVVSTDPEQAQAFAVPSAAGASGPFRALAAPGPGGKGVVVVAVPLTEVSQTLQRLLLVMVLLTAVVLVVLALLSWWIVRRGLRPLERMGGTAEAIAQGDLSRRVEVVDAQNEVGRLGVALNAMLAQIEGAFAERVASEERLRRFLADASHELRTPVTSIRGYAELFRRGARQRPDDLATTLRRIEQEAARMGKLVEDMLLLARLDQARPFETAPVDLATIAADAVLDARASDPSRDIALTTPTSATVQGDEDRLRQVISNLLGNALAHTPAGSPVEVDVRAGEEIVVLSVADRGMGLTPDEAARVFEPFYRSDEGRSRDKGGSGLGLSIVAAIVAAHGGAATVGVRPGGGSVFSATIPRRRPEGHLV